jgi:hypothetical protein
MYIYMHMHLCILYTRVNVIHIMLKPPFSGGILRGVGAEPPVVDGHDAPQKISPATFSKDHRQ